MRAVLLRRFGEPAELTVAEVADPVAGPGQVVITVGFASITFVETQIRSGHPPVPAMAPVLPVIPGNGVGGIVSAVGTGADPALLGRRVVSTTGGSGGYAERVAVPAASLIDVPPAVALPEATALLADGRTAMGLMAAAAIEPGETVLVEAAAGGVGSLLTQLAVAAGATVVAVAGGVGKLAVAAGLGAAVTVDYGVPDWPQSVAAAAGPVDVVFDGVGGAVGTAAFGLLRDGGRCFSYGMASGQFAQIPAEAAAARGVSLHRGVPVSPERMRELSQAALAAAADGTLRPLIGQVFPLAEAAAAHAAIESRQTAGKTLLATELAADGADPASL
jgi:NADPH:quinone reductase